MPVVPHERGEHRRRRSAQQVHDELVGRQRHYRLDTTRLTELARWLGRFDDAAGWERRLDALETEVHRTRRERRARDGRQQQQGRTA